MTRLLRTPALAILALAAVAPLATAATRAPAVPVRVASPFNPIVSQSDTFLVNAFGFQDLAGACQPRGWIGEDRSNKVFAHTSATQLVNQAILTGLPPDFFGPSGPVDLTAGAIGGTLVHQTFNETRGVDVTVLSAQPLHVGNMTVSGLSLFQPTGTVAARIYTNPSGTLIGSSVTVPISGPGPVAPVGIFMDATLSPGQSYRISFYVTNCDGPLINASLPFVESTGNLRITAMWAHGGDVYPTNTNLGLPHFTLNLVGAPAGALSSTPIYQPSAVALSATGHI